MQPQHFASHLITQQDSAAGEYLRDAAGGALDVLIVLGSGLAEALDDSPAWGQPITTLPLSSVPGLVAPVADGHVNELRLYEHEADDDHRLRIAVALGRTHLYEGMGPGPVTALARAAVAAGASTAILCNANGCLREWELGDVMTITDHANLTGTSPFDGTIFLDTSACWDAELAAALGAVTQRAGSCARFAESGDGVDAESATDCTGDAGQHDPTRSLGAVLDCGDDGLPGARPARKLSL